MKTFSFGQIQQQKLETDMIHSRKVSNHLNNLQFLSSINKYKDNKILVVDDEEFCISAMKGILFKCGLNLEFQVDFCISGQQAFDLVKEMYTTGQKYRLILTDFNMPEVNGIQATKMIRDFLQNQMKVEKKDQPIIIGVTGHAHDSFK